MRSLQRFAVALALPFTMLVAGAGCVAEADDEATQDELALSDVADEADEATGEASQAWFICHDLTRTGLLNPLITGLNPLHGFFPCGFGFGGFGFGGCC